MRDPNRIYKFCNELAKYWITYCPDWRFGQLVENIRASEFKGKMLFYVDDDKMQKAIREYFEPEE